MSTIIANPSPNSIRKLVRFLKKRPHVELRENGKITRLVFDKIDKDGIYWNNRLDKFHSYDQLVNNEYTLIEPGIEFDIYSFTIIKGDKKKVYKYL